jgi:hypothetical protein
MVKGYDLARMSDDLVGDECNVSCNVSLVDRLMKNLADDLSYVAKQL